MKNRFFIYAMIWCGVFLAACEEDLNLYDTETCWVRFNLKAESDTLINRSFIYVATETDTVWIPLKTIGKVMDYDRPVSLVQVQANDSNAVAGTHFVAFDDPGLSARYVIPAGKTAVELPIVLKRDPSLETTKVQLTIALGTNEYFQPGFVEPQKIQIWITDQLDRPALWVVGGTLDEKFGEYDPALHQFLIDATDEKWDDDYLKSLGFIEAYTESWGSMSWIVDTGGSYDSAYINWLVNQLQKALAEENATRSAKGEEPLKRSDGTELTIG